MTDRASRWMVVRNTIERLNVPLTITVVVAQAAGAYLFGSGGDFALFREATFGSHPDVWLPPYGYWLLRPFMVLPPRLGLAAMALTSGSLLAWAGHYLTGSALPALLASSSLLSAETGQIDGFVAIGIAIGIVSCEQRRPHLLGFALLLMSLKPQLSALAAVWMLLHLRDWRTLVIPTGMLLVSMLAYGLWPLHWLAGASSLQETAQNISAWRVLGPGVVALAPLPFLFSDGGPRRCVALASAASVLVMPYYNLYSLGVLFATGLSPWLVPLTYLPFVPWPITWAAWRVLSVLVIPVAGIILLVRTSHIRLELPSRFTDLAILLISFLVRVALLASRDLWYDEAFSLSYAAMSPSEMISGTVTPTGQAGAADVHPLLYYFLLHSWFKLAGYSPFAARYLSVVLGMVTIAVLWRLAARYFGSATGQTVGFLAAVQPFHVAFSREARMYSLLALGVVSATWGFLGAMRTTQREHRFILGGNRSKIREIRHIGFPTDWAVFIVGSVITLYAHNLGAFYLLALHSLLFLKGQWRSALPRVALADLIVLTLFAPWLLRVLPGQVSFVRRGYWLSSPGADELVRAFMLPVLTYYEPAPAWLVALGLFVSLLIFSLVLLHVWRSQSPVGRFLLLAWEPIALLLAVSLWRPLYLERALLPSALFYLVAIGWLLSHVATPRAIRLGLSVMLLLCNAASIHRHYEYERFPRPPFREAVGYLEARVQPGDAVVHTSKLTYFPMMAYDPEMPGMFLADAPGSPQDTLAYPTQRALDIYPTSSITAAVEGANRAWIVYFARELQEAREAEGAHSAVEWMDNHFEATGREQFSDLVVALYVMKRP